jgi:hypothetical protein
MVMWLKPLPGLWGDCPETGEALPGNFGQDRKEKLLPESFLPPEYRSLVDGADILPPSDDTIDLFGNNSPDTPLPLFNTFMLRS